MFIKKTLYIWREIWIKTKQVGEPLSDWTYDPLHGIETMPDAAFVDKNLKIDRPET